MYKIATLLFFSLFALCECRILLVKTKSGTVRGKYWRSREGRIFYGFTGIPYAKPPVGDRRFKAPIPSAPWKGVLNATKTHEACPQFNIYSEGSPAIGSEDCLYLNIYTPQLLDYGEELLPVMFYIHGGSFTLGSGKDDWLGPEIFLDKDIVLVTVNYRLGAFGFLSTGDEVVPGNNGLKDQALALNWVYENIVSFGGDPKKITVFGNSAGAACVHFLMLSPLTKDLLNGAIAQSGSAFSIFAEPASSDEARRNAIKLGNLVNCSTNSSRDLIECLEGVDAYEILRQEAEFVQWYNDITPPFKPVVESNEVGAFLTERPVETIKSGNAANIPFMTGITAQEGAYKAAALNAKPELLDMLDRYFNFIIPLTFGITSEVQNSSEAIREFYFGNEKIDNLTKAELTDMYSDGWFLLPLDTTVRLHIQHSTKPVYQYLFGYRGSTSYSTLFGDPTYDYGVCHTDELLHLYKLGLTFPNYKPTDVDVEVSKVLVTLWTNFAKTGNPTPETSCLIPVKWKPVQTANLEYYHIRNYTDMQMAERLYANRTEFWRNLPVGTNTADKR